MKRARIDKTDEKTYRVMLGNHEIGTSKTSFDAQFHVNVINDAIISAIEKATETVRHELAQPFTTRGILGYCIENCSRCRVNDVLYRFKD